MIRRRDFITLLGGAAAWPLAAHAQQGNRVRRIGVLLGGDENDPATKTFVSAFTKALADLGWTDGRNVRMDLRWHGDDNNRARALAQELVGLQPEIIVTYGTPATVAVQRETRTIPIVFATVLDPVATGLVALLDRPSGNVTGLSSWETDQVDIFRRAASYVDRILRGEKPGDLPVQFPTKFEMVVDGKTAKALGLAIPPSIRLRADEVID